MAIRIREDENETGGYAFLDLGRKLESPVRLSFRRQDADPRHLGMEGWQPEVAWHALDVVPRGDASTVVRVGPNVVDWIDELVPVEIVAEGTGLLGTVVWPQLTRSPRRLTELRLSAAGKPSRRVQPLQPPASAPPLPPKAPEPSATQPKAVLPETRPQPQVPAAPSAATKPKLGTGRLIAMAAGLAVLVIVAVPLGLLHLGRYKLVADVRGPSQFIEQPHSAAPGPQFVPASTTIEVRRSGWARWFEGWWLKDPPPADPVLAHSWLVARKAASSPDAVMFVLAPEPKAFPAGVARLETTVAFRNIRSEAVSKPHKLTLQRAPGRLLVDLPAGVVFRGHQGGPFAPARATFNLASQGLGLKWSLEGTVPYWLEIDRTEGELRDNQSAQVGVKPRDAAQMLAPGTYEAPLIFRDRQSGALEERSVRMVVDSRPVPPAGHMVIDMPQALVFTGPQGGPFTPPKIPFHLKAVGTGFKWAAEGSPGWMELAPAQGELRDNTAAELAASPRKDANALPVGTHEAQVLFRKVGQADAIAQPVRVIVEPPSGPMRLDVPTPIRFAGPQGGPFAPQQVTFHVKAEGRGFKWTVEGAPEWLELSPSRGELRDNAVIEVAAKARSNAEELSPGTYQADIMFRKSGGGEPVKQTVRLMVSLHF